MTDLTEMLTIEESTRMRGAVEALADNVGGLAIDPPGPRAPRILGIDPRDGLSAYLLQQTHAGPPVWVCEGCVQLSVAEEKPSTCIGCGGEDSLSEAFYPGEDMVLDPDADEQETAETLRVFEEEALRRRSEKLAKLNGMETK